MARRRHQLDESTITLPTLPSGQVSLVMDDEHFRRVVRDGISAAQVSVTIATADFKAMLVPSATGRSASNIVDVFDRLAKRGVEIRLLHAGIPSNPVLQRLRKGVPEGLTIRRCPRLHAKLVIIDCERMYLGSANLTGAGLGAKGATRRNFELGVWTEDADLIDPVEDWFNSLWEGDPCETCGRREVCPVPLEEPEL